MSISEFKKQFFQSPGSAHLNNSGQALISIPNRDLAIHWINRLHQEGAFCALEGWSEVEKTREMLSRFLGAETEELAFFTTTASALSQAAFGIPLNRDDEILTWDQEYPSNFYPWRMAAEKSGAKIVQIPSREGQTPVEYILEKVNSRTKVIAVSWVQYQNGSITDLKQISQALKNRNIWLVSDVIQGVGVRPFNFHDSGFDIVCGGSHKFMCSGYGASYMVIRKEKLPELKTLEFGAMTFGTPDTPKSFTSEGRKDARKFEPGSKALIEVIAMQATLRMMNQAGLENIYHEANRLASLLRQNLITTGYSLDSAAEGPIVNVVPHKQTSVEKMIQRLNQSRVSFAPRGRGIRLSTHAYNREDEIERAILALR